MADGPLALGTGDILTVPVVVIRGVAVIVWLLDADAGLLVTGLDLARRALGLGTAA